LKCRTWHKAVEIGTGTTYSWQPKPY